MKQNTKVMLKTTQAGYKHLLNYQKILANQANFVLSSAEAISKRFQKWSKNLPTHTE